MSSDTITTTKVVPITGCENGVGEPTCDECFAESPPSFCFQDGDTNKELDFTNRCCIEYGLKCQEMAAVCHENTEPKVDPNPSPPTE